MPLQVLKDAGTWQELFWLFTGCLKFGSPKSVDFQQRGGFLDQSGSCTGFKTRPGFCARDKRRCRAASPRKSRGLFEGVRVRGLKVYGFRPSGKKLRKKCADRRRSCCCISPYQNTEIGSNSKIFCPHTHNLKPRTLTPSSKPDT